MRVEGQLKNYSYFLKEAIKEGKQFVIDSEDSTHPHALRFAQSILERDEESLQEVEDLIAIIKLEV